jgi:hypothetical protein
MKRSKIKNSLYIAPFSAFSICSKGKAARKVAEKTSYSKKKSSMIQHQLLSMVLMNMV